MEQAGSRIDDMKQKARDALGPLVSRVRSSIPPGAQHIGRKAEQAFARIVDRFATLRRAPEPTPVVDDTPPRAPRTPSWRAPEARVSPSRPPEPLEAPLPADESENMATILRLLADLETAEAWEVRVSAATGLGDFHGDVVLDALVSAVRDPSAEVAIAAIGALARQPGARASADLVEVLRDAAGYISPYTRAAAVCAIGRHGGSAVVPLLLETVHDADAEVSIAAIGTLCELAPAEALPKLRTLLEDRSGYFLPAVRVATASALVRARVLDDALLAALLEEETDDAVREVLRAGSGASGG